MSYNWIRDPKIRGTNWTFPRGTIIPNLFGINADRYPDEEIAPRYVQGIKIWVKAKGAPKHNRHPSAARAMAECPVCLKIVSIGRLAQHGKIHQGLPLSPVDPNRV